MTNKKKEIRQIKVKSIENVLPTNVELDGDIKFTSYEDQFYVAHAVPSEIRSGVITEYVQLYNKVLESLDEEQKKDYIKHSKEVLAINLVKNLMKDVTIRETNYSENTILSVSIVVEDLYKLSDINQELSKQGGNK
jgi:hypothetical protein